MLWPIALNQRSNITISGIKVIISKSNQGKYIVLWYYKDWSKNRKLNQIVAKAGNECIIKGRNIRHRRDCESDISAAKSVLQCYCILILITICAYQIFWKWELIRNAKLKLAGRNAFWRYFYHFYDFRYCYFLILSIVFVN